jgi:hypothetical protein
LRVGLRGTHGVPAHLLGRRRRRGRGRRRARRRSSLPDLSAGRARRAVFAQRVLRTSRATRSRSRCTSPRSARCGGRSSAAPGPLRPTCRGWPPLDASSWARASSDRFRDPPTARSR